MQATNVIDVCITAAYLGAKANLVVSEGSCSWSQQVPDDCWILDVNAEHERDVMTLCKLASIDIEFPSAALRAAVRALNCDDAVSPVPWALLSSPRMFRNDLRELLRVVQDVLNSSIVGYHGRVFKPTSDLLNSLSRCRVDVTTLEHHIDDERTAMRTDMSALMSFIPDDTGFAERPVYDVLGGRTGRLKVITGPQVLRLRRDHRDIMRSRFDGGRIVMIDMVSLEPRIAALEAGHRPEHDMYMTLMKHVDAPRGILKLATLTALFGGSPEEQLRDVIDHDAAYALVDAVSRYFDVQGVTERLRVDSNGEMFVTTKMGRRIRCIDERRRYNSYVQATGVEVANTTFVRLNDMMRARQLSSRPLFIIHDAMIVDVHPNDVDALHDVVCAVTYNDVYDAEFPMTIKDVTA